MDRITFYPDIQEVCGMLCSTDVLYKGQRYSRIEPHGDEHVHFVGHDPKKSFTIKKSLVNINDFTMFQP